MRKSVPKNLSDLSEDEIRGLLRRKIASATAPKLAHYRRVGRVVQLSPDQPHQGLEHYYSQVVAEEESPSFRVPGRLVSGSSFLLLMELAAVAFILYLASSGFFFLRSSNQGFSQAWDLPALTPTPPIQAVVIPSGHLPPSLRGETRPNDSEIPLHLRPAAQVFARIPTQTPAPEHPIRLRIPALAVDAPVVQGDGWEQLKKGVGQHTGTANPGQKGNLVLSGHNDVFGEVFRYLDRLKPGDEIIIYSPQRSYIYIVTGWFLVEPSQVEVLTPSPDATVTLISCYPYLINSHRIIVKGSLSG
jgi:sortase A